MNRIVVAGLAAVIALLIPAQALACVPVPAKTWSGNIQFANHASVSRQSWDNNNCAFHDSRLNGFDAIAFDVTSHKGLPATAKWSTTHVTKPGNVQGVYYTASCTAIPSTGFTEFSSDKAVNADVPATAKWLVVVPGTIAPGKDITVTITSPGRKCPTA